MKIKLLLSALVFHSHNIKLLHWNVEGLHFDIVHKTLDEYYKMLQDYTDEVAEIGSILGVKPVSLTQAVEILKNDERQYVIVDPEKSYNSKEAYVAVCDIFSNLVDLYDNVCQDENISADIINKLQEQQYSIRKEWQYKTAKRLKF